MKIKTVLLLSLCFLFLPGTVLAQDATAEKSLKRKVAIGRFSNETQYSKSVFYDKENDPMGKQASDILSAKLGGTDKFLLIERQDYDKLVQEISTSGVSAQNIGADYLIIGSITEYGRKTVGSQKVFSSGKTQTVEAGVSIRLVDVSTGLVIFTGEAKGEATSEDRRVLGFGKTADFDATLSDKAISAAITKLVEGIMKKCLDNPWKAYILSCENNDEVIISGGKSQGLSSGDTFVIAERGKKVKNPQTNITIELPPREIGKLKVTQTVDSGTPESEVSVCSITEGKIDPSSLEKYIVIQNK